MMQIRYQNFDDFIVVNKGFGLRTHRVSDGQLGFVEYLSEKLQQKLLVVHRLDKETSGLMLLAKSKMAAQKLAELFESRQVQKTYFFLTDRIHAEMPFVIESFIDKEENQFVQSESKPPNSKTEFEFVKKMGNYFLWKAKPETGKPHQIRLHAERASIPVLGDSLHGGSPFFRLALHAASISFIYDNTKFELDVARPEILCLPVEFNVSSFLQACFEKRNELFFIPEAASYRLTHLESEKIRADVFADHLWIYDYTEKGLTETEKKSAALFAEQKQLKLIVRHMLDRGPGVGGLEKKTLDSKITEQTWIAQEEGLQFVLKTDSGFSPGLFLDQRANRNWVRHNSLQKKVLNLFSYTAGFSLAAAVGQAQQVTTVDVSSRFLDWSKENFAANQLELKNHEFFAQDCLLFLKGALKRSRQWDLIICDPPTFGRSKDSVWKIERDLPELAELLWGCLEKQGRILFTCNYEKMNRDEVLKLFLKKIPNSYQVERLPQMDLDYEHTDDIKSLMKGFFILKN